MHLGISCMPFLRRATFLLLFVPAFGNNLGGVQQSSGWEKGCSWGYGSKPSSCQVLPEVSWACCLSPHSAQKTLVVLQGQALKPKTGSQKIWILLLAFPTDLLCLAQITQHVEVFPKRLFGMLFRRSHFPGLEVVGT